MRIFGVYLGAVVSGAICFAFGCSTNLEVVVDADPELAASSSQLLFEARTQEGQVLVQDVSDLAQAPFPIRRSVAPRGSDVSRPVTISVRAVNAAGETLATARSIRSFIPGQRVEVRIRLYEVCLGTNCTEGFTCVPFQGRPRCVDVVGIEGSADAGVDANGADVCPAGQQVCDEQCIDTQTDRAHCGRCGRVCSVEQICSTGSCRMVPCDEPADCSSSNYCNRDTGECLPGCDEASDCGNNSSCNMDSHQCACTSGNRMCDSVCATCPTLANATGHTCDGNACILSGCTVGYERNATNTHCDDINECDVSNGGCGAGSCTNTPGGSICTCDAPNRICGSNCVACPSDVNATSTACSGGNACVIASCRIGFGPSTSGLVCAPSSTMDTWTELPESLHARHDHAMAYDSRQNRVVVLGGADNSHYLFEATWRLQNNRWSVLATIGPQPRSGHEMVYDSQQNRIVLFGGYGGMTTNGSSPNYVDTWVFQDNAWTQLAATGPTDRVGYAMVYDGGRNRVVLFGGLGAENLNDTWVFQNNTWRQLHTTGPSPRRGHAMVYDSQQNRVVLFGGSNGNVDLNDTWVLQDNTWTQLLTTATAPTGPARYDHAMVYDSRRNRIVLFGGSNIGGSILDDTWVLQDNNWRRLSSPGPSARTGHAMVYDSGQNRVMLFGGRGWSGRTRSSVFWGDTWVLQ